MNKKKILWIGILVLFIAIIGVIAVVAKPLQANPSGSSIGAEHKKDGQVEQNKVSYQKKVLPDGVIYSTTGDVIKPDMVIGDKYFDTTISDMILSPKSYKGKKIEIEGMFLGVDDYTFVGRYSTSNLCSYCPEGYSYMEYQLQDDIDIDLKNEQDWIKLVGTWEIGKDNVGTEKRPVYEEYYYLKVLSIEIMNERGQDTVNN